MVPARRSLLAALAGLGLAFAGHGAGPILKVEGPDSVALGQRIEFRIEWDRTFRNPFDPDEVEMDLEVTPPSGAARLMPCFQYQPCEHRLADRGGRKTEWIYPVGAAGWRARFAPDEPGRHRARVRVKAGNQRAESGPVTFSCLAGPDKGCVRVSRSDPRFLEFGDGTPFFPIGHNVAFIGESQYLDTERASAVFRKMATNGANFARVWVCAEDWGLAIEARKSAWGRSWDWKPPFVPMPAGEGAPPGRLCLALGGTNRSSASVSPSHPVALRPGTVYRVKGQALGETGSALVVELPGRGSGETVSGTGRWGEFERTFTTASNQWWLGDLKLRVDGPGRAWIAALSLREAAGGPELLTEADPNSPARGIYHQKDCFMLDRLLEAAERTGIYLQLCLLTRDLYRGDLKDPASAAYARATADARKFLRHAVARWGSFRAVAAWEYFNEMDPGAPTARFYGELGEHLERVDPYRHLRTTSAWGPAPADWSHPRMDIAQLHWYLRPVWGNLSRDETAAVLDRTRLLRATATNRPALLAEFGLADDKWGLSPYMAQDKEGVHFHNSLWASAFSGLSGAAMFWWWETLDWLDLYHHYRPLAEFVADIPFASGRLQPVVLDTEKKGRALAWRGRDCWHGWISNPQATWWNQVVEKQQPAKVQGDTLVLEGLNPGAYRLEWRDPGTGRTLRQEDLSVSGPQARLNIPAYTRDIACKVRRAGAASLRERRRQVGGAASGGGLVE